MHTLLPREHTRSSMRWSLLAMGAVAFTVMELGLGSVSESNPNPEHPSISSSTPWSALPPEADWSSVAF